MSQGRPSTDPGALRLALEAMPLFRDLDPAEVDALVAGVRTRRYRRGEVVFHQGDPGDALHIVLSGRVKISSPSDTGVEAILTTLRPGEWFGALALLDGAPRSASATAVGPTETLVLPRERFRQLVDVPSIRDHVFAALAHELRRLTSHVEELHFLDIAGRLAARLVRMAEEQGSGATGGETRLDGPITQGELAAMVGSTRQSINKLLGYLVADGLIRVDRDSILILDLDGLRRAAHR